MNPENKWLEKEIANLKYDMRVTRRRRADPRDDMRKCIVILFLLLPLLFLASKTHAEDILPPSYDICANDRIYINSEELDCNEAVFMFHIGENIWLKTIALHRDETGLYTFESEIETEGLKTEYQKMWKCPYCHRYWPIGKACQNPDCPSKYKRRIG
jgi:hypothetical protein